MRRSTKIRLTLLPLLASAAAVAHAQAPGDTPPQPAPPPAQTGTPGASTGPDGPYVPLTIPTIENFGPAPVALPDGAGYDSDDYGPGAPGNTPPLTDECREDPDLDGCPTAVWVETTYTGGVIQRGGFGGYFHASGGYGRGGGG